MDFGVGGREGAAGVGVGGGDLGGREEGSEDV